MIDGNSFHINCSEAKIDMKIFGAIPIWMFRNKICWFERDAFSSPAESE